LPLEFHKNAIVLSGVAGTKLKCDLIGNYYKFWWGITSGGPRSNYRNLTSIIELNAATGEVYIEDAQETFLGSAGQALELKANNENTRNMQVVLIEKDSDCYYNLKKVIERRWPKINLRESEGSLDLNTTGVYLIKEDIKKALAVIDNQAFGNSLYFFDPLRSVEYSTISEVANKRIRRPFETGTEFFIFSFTSDWFLGRKNFVPLPNTTDKSIWSKAQNQTVQQANDFFGSQKWQKDFS
jgi:three-Cys-motif partner protein